MFLSLRRLACTTAIIGLMAATPVHAVMAASFSDAQRQEIGEVVKDYLLKNPEILQEVMTELERRQQEELSKSQAAALNDMRDTLMDSSHGSVVGNPKGDVTLVEFFDYNCGYCKRAVADIGSMIKQDPNLRVVLKDMPVLGQESIDASHVSLAVKQQISGDKLFDYHSRLMLAKGRIGSAQALALAQEMGLDMARLKKDMDSQDIKAALQENFMLGDKLGLSGTPAFIVGGTVVPGAVGQKPLQTLVENTRKCGKATC